MSDLDWLRLQIGLFLEYERSLQQIEILPFQMAEKKAFTVEFFPNEVELSLN